MYKNNNNLLIVTKKIMIIIINLTAKFIIKQAVIISKEAVNN